MQQPPTSFKMKYKEVKPCGELEPCLHSFWELKGDDNDCKWERIFPDGYMDFDGFISGIDTIFYGRVSYDTWGNFQPDTNASPTEQMIWKEVHSKKKFDFSSQSRQDDKATFIHSDIADKVNEIKKLGGKDIWLYGGASLIKTFIQLCLIDIYRISVHPVALGSGKPLFENLKERLELRLIKTKTFKSGVVQLIYEPKK